MNGHKFISGDVEEIFNGDVFIESANDNCYVCGALFERIRLNYLGDFTYATDMSVCSGNVTAHSHEGISEANCTCLWCDA
jgi:hypothetical protein